MTKLKCYAIESIMTKSHPKQNIISIVLPKDNTVAATHDLHFFSRKWDLVSPSYDHKCYAIEFVMTKSHPKQNIISIVFPKYNTTNVLHFFFLRNEILYLHYMTKLKCYEIESNMTKSHLKQNIIYINSPPTTHSIAQKQATPQRNHIWILCTNQRIDNTTSASCW